MNEYLDLHAICGGAAFGLAPACRGHYERGMAHRLWGAIYFWCMAGVASTALIMAVWRPVLLLALIAVFSFYTTDAYPFGKSTPV
jgi:hypothetical protein